MDIAAISAGLSGLKTASDLTSRLREALTREIKLDEVQARLIEILNHVADGRVSLIDAQEEILTREKRIAELESKVHQFEDMKALESRIEFDSLNNVYRFTHASGEKGLICPACWGRDQKIIPLRREGRTPNYKCDAHGGNTGAYFIRTSDNRPATDNVEV